MGKAVNISQANALHLPTDNVFILNIRLFVYQVKIA